MAAQLKNGGNGKSAPPPPVSVETALEYLATALRECNRAGLGARVLTLPGGPNAPISGAVILPGVEAHVVDGRAVFTVRHADAPTVPAAPANG